MPRTHIQYTAGDCPIAGIVAIIGGRHKASILLHLRDQPRRFNELKRLIPGISQRMLTLQLRGLESDGVICRTSDGAPSGVVLYAFTPHGCTLGPILEAMTEWWAQRHQLPSTSVSSESVL